MGVEVVAFQNSASEWLLYRRKLPFARMYTQRLKMTQSSHTSRGCTYRNVNNIEGISMHVFHLCFVACFISFASSNIAAEEKFSWPDGKRMAISLSYDDAIDSQLDTAIPSLNSYGLRASFYLTLASPTVQNRLNEWRAAAMQGHELGNHTIYHPCSAALPDRNWVASYYNIDKYVVEEIVHEITVANSFLQAIDGRTERTLTPPCDDVIVSGEDYIPAVRNMFVAIKGHEFNDPTFAVLWAPVGVSGSELIDRVKAEAANDTKLFSILFHGIGGDYLAVSSEAHDQLLSYLADNRDIYWVDSYVTVMKYTSEHPALEAMR
jgi:peptidoglycan/xylan/chitin deacetylase (PgdA/CDA1 family)